ncbi:MAG: hypothetical protein LBR14_03835 [Clostridiales Family XIII bacterium]|jgi:hypothetical protein|nr:hypothetical protein [Clostridiales Family XIII bacterium]
MAEKLRNIDAFRITDEEGTVFYGGDQDWLPAAEYRCEAACGATTAANILAYHIRTKPEYRCICGALPDTKHAFVELLKDVYRYVTPGLMGTMPDIFMRGSAIFAAEHGFTVTSRMMQIPSRLSKRPAFADAANFLEEAFEAEEPVAFLNLSNGGVKNLDSYHWVTAVSVDRAQECIRIVDNGNLLTVSLGGWLAGSTLGGALLAFTVEK